MRVLQGHVEDVMAVTFAPDGRTLVTGGLDKTVRLWDPGTGQERTVLGRHPGAVYAVAFSPDGRTLASAGGSMSLRLWDVAAGRKAADLKGHTAVVKCAAFDPEGKVLASGAGDRSLSTHRRGQAMQWDLAHLGVGVTLWEAAYGVLALAFGPGGRLLALGLGDRQLVLWDRVEQRAVRVLRQSVVVRAVAFHPDGQVLASVAHRRVCLWPVPDAQTPEYLDGHEDRVCTLAFTPDGRFLLSGGWDGTVRLWDVARRKQHAAYDWQVGKVCALAVAPDGMTAAAAGSTGRAVIWDLDGA
jgi:WD40 repeat protein